ncbi:hypothetical protein [Alkalibacterium sp.]|nr:MAG: hypothetical protein EA249_06790 [Alkalibacterium sp.]
MDSLKINFNQLDSIISNVIRREIDCLTDELYKASQIYYIADSQLSSDIAPLLTSLTSRDVKEMKNPEDITDASSVLICFSFGEMDEKRIEQIRAFNKKGRTVLITSDYDKSELLQCRETIGVHIPTGIESALQKKVLIRQALHLILDDINLKIQSKEASKPVI